MKISSTSSTINSTASSIFSKMGLVLGTLILLWALEGADTLLPIDLDQYGIHPRDTESYWGILFAPFLHGGWAHLISNTIPFVILSGLIIVRGTFRWILVSLITAVIGGVGIWRFGDVGTVHIGASILIFGYAGYLFANAWFERSWQSITLALITLVLYGGILLGLNPFQTGVSWEGHLFGFIGGAVAGRFLAKKK